MSKLLKLRRGTTAQHSTFTGALAEVTVDTTKKTLVVHDNATPGGNPLATSAELQAVQNSLGALAGKNTVATADLDNGSVTPAKLSTGRPSWDASGYLNVPGGLNVAIDVGSGDANIELGNDRAGSGPSYIDFHSQPGTDYDARIIRNPGSGGNLDIQQVGAGTVNIYRNGVGVLSISDSNELQFNSGFGSAATAYGCRAWVNFNGTGTVSIRNSGNVSSITDNGTGDYTVNFITAMPDANYSVSLAYTNEANSQHGIGFLHTLTTGSVRVQHYNAANSSQTTDKAIVAINIFR